MPHIAAFALVVPDYDLALDFNHGVLGWDVITDKRLSATKRWVLVAPPGGQCRILLAKADGDLQSAAIGQQTGGRVGFFLSTNDFARDHARMIQAGVHFCEKPRHEIYGIVAVWQDPFGNRWDLLQPSSDNPI